MPGDSGKVIAARHFFGALADHMADPEKWAYMLREHGRTLRKQLAEVEKARAKERRPQSAP